MSFFGGIIDGISSAFGAVSDVVKDVTGAVTGPVANLVGAGTSLIGSMNSTNQQLQSVRETNEANKSLQAQANQFNADQAALNRDWQTNANQKAMDFTARQNANAMQFSAQQIRGQQDYETQMSNTAYQRAVADMRAAGLNPMLAVSQGGASTPSVGAASGVSGSGVTSGGSQATGGAARMESTAGINRTTNALLAASTAADVLSKRNMAEQIQAQTNNINADTANKVAQEPWISKLAGSQSYQLTTQGHVNQANEESIIKSMLPNVDKLLADAAQSRASATQLDSQNMAVKALMANPETAKIAPFLQLFLNRGK